MQQKGAQRLYEILHKDEPYHDGTFEAWAKDPSPDFPFHFADGVTIWMAEVDVNPDDKFLG